MAFERRVVDARVILMAAVGGSKDASMCRRGLRDDVGLMVSKT